MTSKSRVFVLVGDEQTPLSPSDVAGSVMSEGFKTTSMRYGFSESTLRKFLAENGIRAKRMVVYEKAPTLKTTKYVTSPVALTPEAEAHIGG